MLKDFHELLDELNIIPHDDRLYAQAFTHASYKNENPSEDIDDYDRLEFIGDGVLDLVIADFVYNKFKDKRSGELSKCRSSLVRGATLASFSRKMHFERYIRLSKGESKNPIASRILEDCFEAFIGAYYLDNSSSFDKVKSLVLSFFADALDNYEEYETFDYKSRFQEMVQSSSKAEIKYVTIKESGTAQAKRFEVAVTCDGVILGTGSGSSKKKAEQAAAKNALEKRVS